MEQASAEARRQNYTFSALVYKYNNPEREKQEEREISMLQWSEEWGQENPDVPLGMARGTALHQEMARINDQLGLMDSPSAPVVPDEAVNAGSPIPAHDRGVSSKSAWKEEQADSKGVTGVSLENENEIEPIPERNPAE